MKPLSLSACLAMAATAAAAELKEPSQVASDWNQTIAAAREPVLTTGPLGLNATAAGPLTFRSGREPRPPRSPRLRRNGDVFEVPLNPPMDPGIQKIIPGNETPPPGAKPWYYRGRNSGSSRFPIRRWTPPRPSAPSTTHPITGFLTFCPTSSHRARSLSRNDAVRWASVSIPTLRRARRFPVAGMETGDHRLV
jgi:hypothetical protein